MLIKIQPENPQENLIKRVVHLLNESGVIAFPTDTVYGMGCSLYQKEAIAKLYEMKQLSKQKRLSFLCRDFKEVSRYAQMSDSAYKMMKRLLPGPYTFILPASREVPRIVFTAQKTVGIRIPDQKICQALLKELGHPMVSTSFPSEDGQYLSDPLEIEAKFGNLLDMIVDGGVLVSELSSIIDFTGDDPKVAREGKGDVSYFLARR